MKSACVIISLAIILLCALTSAHGKPSVDRSTMQETTLVDVMGEVTEANNQQSSVKDTATSAPDFVKETPMPQLKDAAAKPTAANMLEIPKSAEQTTKAAMKPETKHTSEAPFQQKRDTEHDAEDPKMVESSRSNVKNPEHDAEVTTTTTMKPITTKSSATTTKPSATTKEPENSSVSSISGSITSFILPLATIALACFIY